MDKFHGVKLIELHLMQLDAPGELKFLLGESWYENPRLGLRLAEVVAILIAKAHDPENRHDEDGRGWVNSVNYPKVYHRLFGIDYGPVIGCSDTLRRGAHGIRRKLALPVFGNYEGAAKEWAKSLLGFKPSRGYRFNLPPDSLKLTIERPGWQFPFAS